MGWDGHSRKDIRYTPLVQLECCIYGGRRSRKDQGAIIRVRGSSDTREYLFKYLVYCSCVFTVLRSSFPSHLFSGRFAGSYYQETTPILYLGYFSESLENMAAALDILSRLPPPLKPIAGAVLSLGACYAINRLLSRRAVSGKRPRSSWKWDEEIVVVTGGSGGIGSAMVEGFARRGVTVVSLDIKPPSDADAISVSEKKSHFYQVDIRSRAAVQDAASWIRTNIGAPTVLINNAGLANGVSLLDAGESRIRDIFDVNILSHFWLVQAFLPDMVRRDHGHVVSVASVASYITLAGNVEYSCTKAGVMAFHEGLGQELRHRYGAKSVLTR